MAAAYHIFKNGVVVAQTTTGRTNPEIRRNTPHGNPADSSGGGLIGKTPGGNGGSIVNGR